MAKFLMTAAEKARRALDRHPDWDNERIAKSARGATHSMINALRAGANWRTLVEPRELPEAGQAAPAPPGNHSGLVPLSRIVERFDIRAAILREIAALPEGELMPEVVLCERTAGKDRNRFRRTVENCGEEFKALRVRARLDDAAEGKWLWGRARDIEAARAIIES